MIVLIVPVFLPFFLLFVAVVLLLHLPLTSVPWMRRMFSSMGRTLMLLLVVAVLIVVVASLPTDRPKAQPQISNITAAIELMINVLKWILNILTLGIFGGSGGGAGK